MGSEYETRRSYGSSGLKPAEKCIFDSLYFIDFSTLQWKPSEDEIIEMNLCGKLCLMHKHSVIQRLGKG